MSQLTVAQVEAAIEEDEDLYWEELEWEFRNKGLTIDGVEYPAQVLDENPRGEWDYGTYIVFSVGDQIFRKTGHFQSHYGNDWDGPLQEVRKAEKTIEVWEAI